MFAYVDALLYTRQSKVIGDDELAVLRQQEDGRKMAEMRGWSVAKSFCDNDISAAGKRYRPGFEEMLGAIQTGRYRAVIGWDMTRLSRNARDRLRLIEACSKHGVTIALVRGADIDPSTPGGRLVAGILGEVAEHEIAQKSDRQRRASKQAAEAGLPYGGGRRPFGFEADKLTVHPAEAAALAEAYRHVLAGMPVGAVARALNEAGFTTTQTTRDGQPSPWTGQNLGPTLLNPRYCGLRARTVRPEHGRPTWEIVGPAKWPAIVSVEVFEAVKGILTDPARRNAPQSGQAMLTGIARCGVEDCGSLVHGGRATTTAAKTYRCRGAFGHVNRAQAPVDEYIGLVVCERLSRPDAVDLLTPARPDTAPLRDELAAARARLTQAPKLWAEGVLTDHELRDTKSTLGARIRELENQLAGDRVADVLRPLLQAEDIEATWFEQYDDDRRRAVVDVLMTVTLLPPGRGTRTFRPETVRIDWKSGDGAPRGA
jgi:site-specific DNA recombinase